MRKAKQNHGVIEDRLYPCPAHQQIRDREIFWEYPSGQGLLCAAEGKPSTSPEEEKWTLLARESEKATLSFEDQQLVFCYAASNPPTSLRGGIGIP
jgi:hypothetical protein